MQSLILTLRLVVEKKPLFFLCVLILGALITLVPVWAYTDRHPRPIHLLTAFDANNVLIFCCQAAFPIITVWLLREPLEELREKLKNGD